jgi:nucleotide-binding universal stress UspA family protein
MQRVVLAVQGRPAALRACLDAAAYAARILGGAHIVAMAPHADPAEAIFPSEEVLTAERRAELQRQDEALVGSLRSAFDEWRLATGSDSEWIETRGPIEAEVASHGRTAELLVTAARSGPGDKAGETLHAALLETHRPVLVVPDRIGPTIGQRIAIAWHEDEPAIAAVLSAMPFLAAADKVWVIEASRSRAPSPALPPLLTEHRIAAERRTIAATRRNPGPALLAEAHSVGADMLVMGAYAHGPLVEALLGGVTRSMLRAADLPLLMRH